MSLEDLLGGKKPTKPKTKKDKVSKSKEAIKVDKDSSVKVEKKTTQPKDKVVTTPKTPTTTKDKTVTTQIAKKPKSDNYKKLQKEIDDLKDKIADLITKIASQENNFNTKLYDMKLTKITPSIDVEKIVKDLLIDFDEFMSELYEIQTESAFHLKEKIAVKGRHKNTNQERVFRIVRDSIDIQNYIILKKLQTVLLTIES